MSARQLEMFIGAGFVLERIIVVSLLSLASQSLAVSHTAHWKISLSDNEPSDQSRIIDLNKWTVNSNLSRPDANFLIVASDGNTSFLNFSEAIETTKALPAEAAEELETDFETVGTTTPASLSSIIAETIATAVPIQPQTTLPTMAATPFTVFAQPPNFSPLFTIPFTFPMPLTTTSTVAVISTSNSTTSNTTTVSEINASNAANATMTTTTTVSSIKLPTLPPFDMSGLPSLIQMAKLLPAMVRSFSSSNSFPSIIPAGSPLGGALGSGSIYQAFTGKTLGGTAASNSDALPTSAVVLNEGSEYGGGIGLPVAPALLPPSVANGAQIFQPSLLREENFVRRAEPVTTTKLSDTPNIRPFGSPSDVFSSRNSLKSKFTPTPNDYLNIVVVPLPENNNIHYPSMHNNSDYYKTWQNMPKQTSIDLLNRHLHNNAVQNMSDKETDTNKLSLSKIHVGTPEVNTSKTAENAEITSDVENTVVKTTSASSWSRGSAQRQHLRLSYYDRRRRLNLYSDREKDELDVKQATTNVNNDGDLTDEISTLSPYAAPMPALSATFLPQPMTSTRSEIRRERPRFDMLTSTLLPLESERNDLKSIHENIFNDNNHEEKLRVDSDLDRWPSTLSTNQNKLAVNEKSTEPTDLLSQTFRRQLPQFNARAPLANKEHVAELTQQLTSAPSASGLDANALRDLLFIKDMPNLEELTKGLDLSLLTQPGGFATLKQQFMQRLARHSMLNAATNRQHQQQQKKASFEDVSLGIRR